MGPYMEQMQHDQLALREYQLICSGFMALQGDSPVDTSIAAPTDISGQELWLGSDMGTWQDTIGGTAASATDPLGEWEDESGEGNHLTQTGASRPTVGATGIEFDNTVPNFIGTSTSALDPGTDDHAISLWFRSPSVGGGTVVLYSNRPAPTDDGYNLALVGGNVRVSHRQSSTTLNGDSAASYDDDTWHHLVVNFDRDGNATAYIDGNLTPVVTLDISSQSASMMPGNPTLGAFGNGTPGSASVTFQLDQVTVYMGHLLTNDEITDLYDYGRP